MKIQLITFNDKELLNLIIGRNGGKTTMKIIDEILETPKNANQISKNLEIDYKTVIFHMKILCGHDYVNREKLDNYYYYHPSEKLIKNLDTYNNIRKNFE